MLHQLPALPVEVFGRMRRSLQEVMHHLVFDDPLGADVLRTHDSPSSAQIGMTRDGFPVDGNVTPLVNGWRAQPGVISSGPDAATSAAGHVEAMVRFQPKAVRNAAGGWPPATT